MHNPKVKAAVKKGQLKHKEYDPGVGFDKEVRTPSSKRADAVNFEQEHVKELKPNNPRAIKKGEKQASNYAKEFQDEFGGSWTYEIETYD